MFRQHQRVEHQSVIDHGFEGGRELFLQHPLRVRDVLDHRPQAHEAGVGGERGDGIRASSLSKSTQPTTPAMKECSRASSSMKRVSATVAAACTRIVAAMPPGPVAARGAQAGSPGRWAQAPASTSRSRRDPGARSADGCRHCVHWRIHAGRGARASTSPRSRNARQNPGGIGKKTWRRNCVLRRHWRIRPPRSRRADAPAGTAVPRPEAAPRNRRTALRVSSTRSRLLAAARRSCSASARRRASRRQGCRS